MHAQILSEYGYYIQGAFAFFGNISKNSILLLKTSSILATSVFFGFSGDDVTPFPLEIGVFVLLLVLRDFASFLFIFCLSLYRLNGVAPSRLSNVHERGPQSLEAQSQQSQESSHLDLKQIRTLCSDSFSNKQNHLGTSPHLVLTRPRYGLEFCHDMLSLQSSMSCTLAINKLENPIPP